MGTSINFIWGIILGIILLIFLSFSIGFNLSTLLITFAIIFGTLILSIPQFFGISYLYNFLAKKLKKITLDIEDMDSVYGVSVIPLALMIGVLSLIVALIMYSIVFMVISLSVMPIAQSLLFQSSTQNMGILLYQIAMLVVNPASIVYAFAMPFLFTIIGGFIFNLIAPKIGGLKLEFVQNGEMTKINNFNPINAGIISGIICLVFGLVISLILAIISGNISTIISLILLLIVGGFLGGFVWGTVCSVIYNFLVKKTEGVGIRLT